MKVKELIEQLQQCDPEAVVCEYDPTESFFEETSGVRYYEMVKITTHKNRSYYDAVMKTQTGSIVVIK